VNDRTTADPPAFSTDSFRARLLRALDVLPEELRRTIIFRDVIGLSYQEISELTGCPVDIVKSRVNQARLRLYREVRFPGTEKQGISQYLFKCRSG